MGMIAFIVANVAVIVFRATSGDTRRVLQYIGLGSAVVFGFCWVFIGVRLLIIFSIQNVWGLIFTAFGLFVLWHCWRGSWWRFSLADREVQERDLRKRARDL